MTTKLPAQDALPFPPTPSASVAGKTMQESVYQRRVTPRRLPEDAPNILVVLIDDAGPGLPSTLGGEVATKTMDRLKGEGIAYNRFHTTAMCSPTRASLLTGRNHHRVGSGQITELANDWDGYSGQIPRSSALAAEVLKDYGYSTARGASGITPPPTRRLRQARSRTGRRVSASSTSTASWRVRHRSTSPIWYGTRRSSDPRKRPTRDTTSARIWRMTPSAGCVTTGRSSLTSRFTCTGPQAACTAHITS